MVKDSGLRGRGGAGFPTGLKWSFVPQNDGKPHYLVVNADESEPGACKDIPIMLANPHALIEGVIITSYAIRAKHAFIYIRGEVPEAIRRVANAVREAREAGYIGTNVLGSGFDLDVVVHAGAGAYICGEETALLDSLEGFRGQPRLKPPFPAVAGLYASPTVINNVETICNIPYIIDRGVDWFRQFGTEKSPGFKVFAVSGHVEPPRHLRGAAGHHDARAARLRRRRARRPRGEVLAAGRLVGADADRRPPRHPDDLRGHGGGRHDARHRHADDLRRHRQRREGGHAVAGVLQARVLRQVHAVPRGHLLDHRHRSSASSTGTAPRPRSRTLVELCGQIMGRSFCALGDAAATPYPAALKYFRDEFVAATTTPADEQFDPVASYVFAGAVAR